MSDEETQPQPKPEPSRLARANPTMVDGLCVNALDVCPKIYPKSSIMISVISRHKIEGDCMAGREEESLKDGISWVDIAVRVAERVNFVSHGEKRDAYADLAKEYDLSPNHLRRLVRALTFTTELARQDLELSKALQRVSFKAAEIIDRWYATNPIEAVAAGRRFVKGGMSVRMLSAAASGEGDAKPAALSARGKPEQTSYYDAAVAKALHAIGREVERTDPMRQMAFLSDVDRVVREVGGSRQWALFVIGPNLGAGSYQARRELDLGRACALASLSITPVFAMPAEASPQEFRRVLDAFGQRDALIVELALALRYC